MKNITVLGSYWTRFAVRGIVWALVSVFFVLAVGCGGTASNNVINSTVVNKALWVANGTNVVEFLPAQVTGGATSMAPHLSINSTIFGAPQGVVFDAAGDLWVVDGGTMAAGGNVPASLFEFTPAQLAALHTNNTPAPNITIRSGSFTFPQQAVFDANGNLWVSDNGSNAVFVFALSQLASTNLTTTPDVTIASTPAFAGPLGIVFDAAGDLFIANNASTTIFGFSAAHLPATGGTFNLVPDVILSDDGNGSIQAPWALIVDAKGDLWSSNANAPNTIVEFAAGAFNTSGSPVPAVTLSPATVGGNATLSAPNGIAFDNLGDLAAISSAAPFGVPLFAKTELNAGGTIAPTVFIVGNTTTLNAPAGCSFGPAVN